jgi:hypothetical protein
MRSPAPGSPRRRVKHDAADRGDDASGVEPDTAPEFDDWARQVYLNEVGWQCQFAEYAGQLYDLALHRPVTDAQLALSFAVHALLSAFANLSKLFDPVPGMRASRGDTDTVVAWRQRRAQALRELLEVDADSPLLDRNVRDAFEHIDEYIDRWIVVQPRPTVDDVEAGRWAPPAEPQPPLRKVDAAGRTVSFHGKTVDLVAMGREVDRVYAKLRTLEPPAASRMRTLMAALTLLPPVPPELRLDAPTRRPDHDGCRRSAGTVARGRAQAGDRGHYSHARSRRGD